MEVDFGDVLEQSRALAARRDAGGVEELPKLERGLLQIDEESRKLARIDYSGLGAGDYDELEERESSAAMLLSEYGFESSKLENQLQSIALMDTLEPFEAFSDTDLESFLKHQREMLILGAVDEVRLASERVAEKQNMALSDMHWTVHKKEMLSTTNHTRGKQQHNSSVVIPLGPFTSPFQSKFGTRSNSSRSRLDVSYTAVVQAAIRTKWQATLAQDFLRVSRDSKRGQHIQNCFLALEHLTSGRTPSDSSSLEFSPSASRKCLELLFLETKVKRAADVNPVVARRGGKPEVIYDIRAYMNLLFEKGVPEALSAGLHHNGKPFWPQLYYCLRCGLLQTASRLVDDMREQLDAAENCRFLDYFKRFIDSGERRSLPDRSLQELVKEYKLSVFPGHDPYQRACYVVIARLDPTAGDKIVLQDVDYNLLFSSIEDYAWLKLSVVRTPADPAVQSGLAEHVTSLESFQKEMLGYGAAHFDPDGSTPFLYGFVLLLCGRFEEAADYISKRPNNLSDAVHVAFLLYCYHGIPSGQYEKILLRYVGGFSKGDPSTAALYISSLSEPDRHAAGIQQLLLDVDEIDGLLGPITEPSVRRSPGALEKLFGEAWHTATDRSRLKVVLLQSAKAAQGNGQQMKALKLYRAAGSDEEATMLLLEMLGPEMSANESPNRRQLFDHARQIGSTQNRSVHTKASRSLEIMFVLYRFFDFTSDRKYRQAWDLLKSKSFLPVNESMLASKLRELSTDSPEYDSSITDNLGSILVTAMECVVALHSETDMRFRSVGRGHLDPERMELEKAARTLINFAGMMRDTEPDVSARLVRLGVFMG